VRQSTASSQFLDCNLNPNSHHFFLTSITQVFLTEFVRDVRGGCLTALPPIWRVFDLLPVFVEKHRGPDGPVGVGRTFTVMQRPNPSLVLRHSFVRPFDPGGGGWVGFVNPSRSCQGFIHRRDLQASTLHRQDPRQLPQGESVGTGAGQAAGPRWSTLRCAKWHSPSSVWQFPLSWNSWPIISLF